MKKPTEVLIQSIEIVEGDDEISALLDKVNALLLNEPENIGLLQSRAELYKKQQKFGLAINDYRTILSIDENNQQALVQSEQLLTILKFRNTDIFESPNTNFDPWLD